MLPISHAQSGYFRRRRFARALSECFAHSPSTSEALELLTRFEHSPLAEVLDCYVNEAQCFKHPALTAKLYYYYLGAARCANAYVEACYDWPEAVPDVSLLSLPVKTRRVVEETLRIDTALRVIGPHEAVKGSLSRIITLAFELRAPQALPAMYPYLSQLEERLIEEYRKSGALDFLSYRRWAVGPQNRAGEDLLWDSMSIPHLFDRGSETLVLTGSSIGEMWL